MSRARVKCRLLVDFDGTIASLDTTDALLERFAAAAWRDIEEDWKAGLIGSRECMLRQIDLVRATPAEIDAFVAGLAIDPGFPAFVRICERLGCSITVVSDGLDRTIEAMLARYSLDLPFRANHLEWRGGDRWRLTFPHARDDCQSLAGTCKCRLACAPVPELSVVVGDGRSDFCVAGRADLVLAKGALREHCSAAGIQHVAFRDFSEATALLAAWLDGHHAMEAPASARAKD